MDTNKESSLLTYTSKTLPSAQLLIGKNDHVLQETERFLQKMFCKNSGCNTCITCMQIREKQHHAIMWLHPEKNYTVDQLEDLFNTISFRLQPDTLFFFIIQKADFLTPACANKLLKPMEEPPHGYHFILLAEHIEQIIPTIRSRCAVYILNTTTAHHTTDPLFENFTTKIAAPNEFSQLIDAAHINERESIELLNTIIEYWIQEYKNMITEPEQTKHIVMSLITTLQQAQLQPPMPGSSILFWRNLYLHLRNNLDLICEA